MTEEINIEPTDDIEIDAPVEVVEEEAIEVHRGIGQQEAPVGQRGRRGEPLAPW